MTSMEEIKATLRLYEKGCLLHMREVANNYSFLLSELEKLEAENAKYKEALRLSNIDNTAIGNKGLQAEARVRELEAENARLRACHESELGVCRQYCDEAGQRERRKTMEELEDLIIPKGGEERSYELSINNIHAHIRELEKISPDDPLLAMINDLAERVEKLEQTTDPNHAPVSERREAWQGEDMLLRVRVHGRMVYASQSGSMAYILDKNDLTVPSDLIPVVGNAG